MEPEKDLFGNVIDDFKSQKEKFGIWPVTVWDCDMSDPGVKSLKAAIGDIDTGKARGGNVALGIAAFPSGKRGRVAAGGIRYSVGSDPALKAIEQSRGGCFTLPTQDESVFRGKCTVSIFNPAVAAWIFNLYAPKSGLCFDPFAGGGTRAIMAAKHGMQYIGVELREEEVDAVIERCKNLGVLEQVGLIVGDSSDSETTSQIDSNSVDFLITCPPYYNLEQYDGGDNDLSMSKTYHEFLAGIQKVIVNTKRLLKPCAVSCWVVGLLGCTATRMAAYWPCTMILPTCMLSTDLDLKRRLSWPSAITGRYNV